MSEILAAYARLQGALARKRGVEPGQMFGKTCMMLGGKAFVAQHADRVVFKLSGSAHASALGQPSAKLWDPSGKGRPMKQWVALTIASEPIFETLATAAMTSVKTGT